MTITELDIVAVWHALGGGPLRGNRGQAFWRGGDTRNVALDAARGTWFDYRDGKGGGALSLVEIALCCSRAAALRWLEENCGLDSRRSFSHEERTERVKQIAKRTEAESWGVAARALAEQVLDDLESNNAARADHTRLLGIIRAGGSALADEYQAWQATNAELTRAMVLAGASSQTRVQRRLAFFLMEVAIAA